jgi:hypothetical protein
MPQDLNIPFACAACHDSGRITGGEVQDRKNNESGCQQGDNHPQAALQNVFRHRRFSTSITHPCQLRFGWCALLYTIKNDQGALCRFTLTWQSSGEFLFSKLKGIPAAVAMLISIDRGGS